MTKKYTHLRIRIDSYTTFIQLCHSLGMTQLDLLDLLIKEKEKEVEENNESQEYKKY